MFDEKDLQAIRDAIKDEIAAAEERIARSTMVMMESYFEPKFNLLAEGQSSILDKLVPRSRVDELEEEVRFLKSMIRQITEDLQHLKKAQ